MEQNQSQLQQFPRTVQRSYHFTKEFPTSVPAYNTGGSVFFKIAGAGEYIDLDQSTRFRIMRTAATVNSSFYQRLDGDIAMQGQATYQLNGRLLSKLTNAWAQQRAYFMSKGYKKFSNIRYLGANSATLNALYSQIPVRCLGPVAQTSDATKGALDSLPLRMLFAGVFPEHIRYIPITTYLQLSYQISGANGLATAGLYLNLSDAGVLTSSEANQAYGNDQPGDWIQLCRLDYIPEGPDVLMPDKIPYLQQDPFTAQTVINCTQSVDADSICQDQYIYHSVTGDRTALTCDAVLTSFPSSYKKNSKYMIDQCLSAREFMGQLERINSEGFNTYLSQFVAYWEWDYYPGQTIQYDIKLNNAQSDLFITYVQQKI